jgi:hypothetical protein
MMVQDILVVRGLDGCDLSLLLSNTLLHKGTNGEVTTAGRVSG